MPNPEVPMRRLILAVLAVCLLIPAAASAKFSAARICGQSECRTITFHDGQALLNLEKPIVEGVEVSSVGAPPRGGPSAHGPKGPWYRVLFCPGPCAGNGAELVRVFPADGYAWMRERGWLQLNESDVSAYRTAARGIRPYVPASAATDPPGGGAGMPAWAWVAIGAAVAGAVLLVYRLAARAKPRDSG
jgi:hypothetical protein